jgi:hypothetical protein
LGEELSGDEAGVVTGVVTASSKLVGAFEDEEEVEGLGVVAFWVVDFGGVLTSLESVEAKIVCTLLSPFLFM